MPPVGGREAFIMAETQPLMSGTVTALSIIPGGGSGGPPPVTVRVTFAEGQECQGTDGTEFQWNDSPAEALTCLVAFYRAAVAGCPVDAGAVLLGGLAVRLSFWERVNAAARAGRSG
jgi:hypothetical protein